MPGHCAGRGSPCRWGSQKAPSALQELPGPGSGDRPPPRISFTSCPAYGIVAGAPALVQLGAGHPEKGTLAPRPPWQPQEAAPHCLRGPGLRGG